MGYPKNMALYGTVPPMTHYSSRTTPSQWSCRWISDISGIFFEGCQLLFEMTGSMEFSAVETNQVYGPLEFLSIPWCLTIQRHSGLKLKPRNVRSETPQPPSKPFKTSHASISPIKFEPTFWVSRYPWLCQHIHRQSSRQLSPAVPFVYSRDLIDVLDLATGPCKGLRYPLVICYIAIVYMAIEIVDFHGFSH